MPVKFKEGIQKRVTILAWLSLGAIAIGELGRFFWLFELFSHFMLYYALVLMAGAFAAKALWKKVFFGVSAALLLTWMNLPALQQGLNSHATEQQPLQHQPLKFVAYNIYFQNEKMANSITWLLDSNADVIFLTETTKSATRHLQALKTRYPYGCARIENSPFGLALYAQTPLTSCEVAEIDNLGEYPYIRAELADGRVIYGIHPPPPITSTFAFERNQLLDAIAHNVNSERHDVLLMGDFNITPFSIYYRQFIKKSNLAATNNSWDPTWVPGLLRIDHILIKSPYQVQAKGHGPWMGSDHRPVWVVW